LPLWRWAEKKPEDAGVADWIRFFVWGYDTESAGPQGWVKQTEEAKKAEDERKAEEKRKAKEKKKAEEERKAEEKTKAGIDGNQALQVSPASYPADSAKSLDKIL